MNLDDLKFRKEDCIVEGALVEHNRGPRPPRWGVEAGNVINGAIGPSAIPALNRVVVTHLPTSITVTEDSHRPYRNREIAFIKVEALVNAWIEEFKAKHGTGSSKV